MIELTIVALVLVIIATYLLGLQVFVWDAFLLLILALGGLAIVFAQTLANGRDRLTGLKRFFPRTWWEWGRLMALLIALWVALRAREASTSTNYAFLFFLWVVALGIFVATVVIPTRDERRIKLQLSRVEWVALGALLLLAALVRGWDLGRIPFNMGGDEGTQLLAGLKLLEKPMQNPFATGWYSVPTMSFLFYGAAMRLWGASIAGGRALSVIIGTATVLTTFLLGNVVGGRKMGWVAALVVAFSSYHIHFSRLASNQIMDPFIGTLSIWLLWSALRERSKMSDRVAPAWALAGMVAGLGWYAYFGARWVTIMIALILGWRALLESRFWAQYRRGLMLFVLGWVVVTLPLWGWYLMNPSTLTERYNAVSIFSSGWVDLNYELNGRNTLQSLLEQFGKSVTAFHLTPDPTFWYYPQRPLLDFVTGALMLVGMLVTYLRWNWPGRSMTLIWFWSTLIMAWTLTENPPSSQRGLLLVPAVGFLVAWGVLALEEIFVRYRYTLRILLGVFLIVSVGFNLRFYFGVYTPLRTYGNPVAERATAFARYAMAYPVDNGVTYFAGPPEIYWEFGTIAFLLHDQQGVNVGPGEIPQGVAQPARFVFLPHREGEVDAVRDLYPGGALFRLTSDDGRLMAIIYDWPASLVP